MNNKLTESLESANVWWPVSGRNGSPGRSKGVPAARVGLPANAGEGVGQCREGEGRQCGKGEVKADLDELLNWVMVARATKD